MNNFTKIGLFTLLLATIFSSCTKEYQSIESLDDQNIQAYIKANNLTMTKDPSGYYYSVLTPGTGAEVKNPDSVYYSYTFKSMSGQVLTQSSNVMIPANFLGYTDRFLFTNSTFLIPPFREVLSKLKRGGTARLIIPSHQAFGKNGFASFNVGSNENIIVDLGMYSESKQHQIDELEMDNFETKNNLQLIKDPSRGRYYITTPGTGTDQISLSSTITVNYTARTLDGTIVDQNISGTYSQALKDLYEGWRVILPGKVTAGGKLRLVIPSDLGSGASPLDFDIEIVSVTN